MIEAVVTSFQRTYFFSLSVAVRDWIKIGIAEIEIAWDKLSPDQIIRGIAKRLNAKPTIP